MYQEIITDPKCNWCGGTGTKFFAIGENDYGKDICDCVELVYVEREDYGYGSELDCYNE